MGSALALSSDTAAYTAALLSIVLSSLAQILLKLVMKQHALNLQLLRQPLLYAGFAVYGVSAVLWLKVLAKLPLVVAYPLVSLNFVFVVLGGSVLLHERVHWQTFVGLGLIFSGIFIITRP